MSSAPEIPSEPERMSKKAAKKEAAKLEKLRRKQEREQQAEEEEESVTTAGTSSLSPEEDESFSRNYGDVDFSDSKSLLKWKEAREGKEWTDVSDLVEEKVGLEVLIRGHVNTNRPKSSRLGFVILRQTGGGGGEVTVQCVAKESKETKVGLKMIKFLEKLSGESIVDVIGVVAFPKEPLIGTSQKV